MALTSHVSLFSLQPFLPSRIWAANYYSYCLLLQSQGGCEVPASQWLSARITQLSCVAEHPANPSPHVSSSAQTTQSSKSQMLSPIRAVLQGPDAKWDKFTWILFWCMCCTLYYSTTSFLRRAVVTGFMRMHGFLHINLILSPSAFSLKSHFSMCLEYVFRANQGELRQRMKWPTVRYHSFPLCCSAYMGDISNTDWCSI